MTENLSGELFSDWARVVSTTSDSLCFLFRAYCHGLHVCPPKERTLASPSFLKGMVLLSEEGNNRSRWRYSANVRATGSGPPGAIAVRAAILAVNGHEEGARGDARNVGV